MNYTSYDFDSIRPEANGNSSRMKIDRSVYLKESECDISSLVCLDDETLAAKIAESTAEEQRLFELARKYASEWEAIAANSALLREAQAYRKIRPVNHTTNQWVTDDYGNEEISNKVYRMRIRTYEDTRYDHTKGELVPCAWFVYYSVCVQDPVNQRPFTIASVDRKRFTDKAKAEAYIAGRKKAYAKLFTEENPPVPKEYAGLFTYFGTLLPGYRVEEEESK